MSADSAVSIGWDVFKWVVVPIKRQLGYVIHFKSFAQDLQKEVGNLGYEVERIQNAMEEAGRNLRNVYSRITEWQANAEAALKEARELLVDFETVSKNCCYGTLPDPSCRYKFSRKAKDTIEGIQRLARECGQFKDIYFVDPAPGNVVAPTPSRREGKDVVESTTSTASVVSASLSIKLRDAGIFESRALMIRKIMGALANDNDNVVGIYGMGGVGKSTILGEVKMIISKEKSFDWIAKADVSKNPDIKMIQGEIADALGLTDIKHKETISGRAELLHGRLTKEIEQKKKVLIILDNLWQGLDLKSVGIPCRYDNKVIGCKLLLTSRDCKVLQREMGCDKAFSLGGLKADESKSLFERIVGDKVHDDEFKTWVEVALHKCAGMPFLIIAMAKRLRYAELYEWEYDLKKITDSKDEQINDLIDQVLEWSYDKLKEDEKSLLRLCVVYGISMPSLENLVRYGVGLGLFQEVINMQEARNRLRSQIHTLQASSLLLDSEYVDGFKIHDLVREFVASVHSQDHPLLVLNNNDMLRTELLKDELKSCTAVCFPHVDMKELLEELDCPEMQIYLLFPNNISLKVSNSYFNSMRNLRVLHLSRVCVTRSPSAFQPLKNLHTLCLDSCSIEDVASIGELKGLHVLSFAGSNIRRLPKEIGQLIELRLLDLNYCSKLEIIDPGVLGSLNQLEELYMKYSFSRWNATEQTPPTEARLIELNNMKNLGTLYVSIPDWRMLPEDLNVEKLIKYKIRIGNVERWEISCKGSSVLELKWDPRSDTFQKGCIQTLLGKTDHLFLDGFNGIEQSIYALSQKGFPRLKHLHVQNSSSIIYVLRSSFHTDWKILESLHLENLINLEKICGNHFSSKSFGALKVVRVKSCDKMEVLFSLSLLRELPHLKEIQVINCPLMREIVEVDDRGKVELRSLHVLKLRNLPNIKSFCTAEMAPSSSTSSNQVDTRVAFLNEQQVAFPSLEALQIGDMDSIEKIWDDQVAAESFPSLKSLHVHGCNKLVNIVEVIEKEGLVLRDVFPRLSSLKLEYLTKLKCVCAGPHALHWPALKTLEVNGCNKMEIFVSQHENEMQLHKQPIFLTDKVAFPSLETLKIHYMDSLERIWDDQVAAESFHKLKSLNVYRCNKLVNIAPSCVLERLRSLEDLEVRSCGSLEAVFKFQAVKPLDGQVVAPFLLRKLEIYELPRLKRVWDDELHGQVKFQCLRSITVCKCQSLTSLFPVSIAMNLIQLEKLKIEQCGIVELIKKEGLARGDTELHSQVKFQCLRSINVSKCRSLTSLFPVSVATNLIQLEKLKIKECGIVELIEGEGLVRRDVFPRLSILKLEHLTELKCVYANSHALCWSALKTLEVNGCDKVEIFASHHENGMLLHKWPLFLIEKGAFQNLQELKLNSLGLMEIWHGRFYDEELFCKLRLLELHNLSMEFATSTKRFVQSLTSLENLILRNSYLEELSIIMEAIDGQSHGRCFRHIKTLDVSCCDGFSKLFMSTIVRNLVELTELRISNCKILTEVICEEGGEEELVLVFSQLKCIELKELTALKCFSSTKYNLKFPLLENVIVNGCPHMKFFSNGLIEAPKLGRVQVSTGTWFWKENLNITIQNMFEEMVMIVGQKVLQLSEFPELIEKWHSELNPIKSSCELENLIVDKCPSFINGISSKLMLVLEKMEMLHVRNCESLEELFGLEELEVVEASRMLPRLRELNLVNLPRLKRLWNKDLQGMMRFNKLSGLTLYNCSNLRHALVPSMAQCLPNLFRIEIKKCGQMEGVIVEEEGRESVAEKITFPNLWLLRLEWLPNLTNFLLGKNLTLDCPQLNGLTIAHCPKMRSLTGQTLMDSDHSTPSLFSPQVRLPPLWTMVLSHMDNLRKIWTDNPRHPPNFERLHKVEVENCKQLENLFPHWVVTNLQELCELRVESCGIKEVVANGDDTLNSVVTQILFPELTSLVFHDMPQLKSFYPTFPTLNCPILEELRVTHCDKLNMLSFAASINKWAPQDDQHDLSDHEAHSLFDRGFLAMERLLLVDKDIQTIQNGKFSDDFFDKTESLTLACFHDENTSFPPRFLPQRFPNLQSFEIYCCSFEYIFLDEVLIDEGKHPMLENLRELKLSKLHNLKQFWREDHSIAKILQSINDFEVWDCPGLTTLFPIGTSFWNLTGLVVKNSSGLIHLMTTSVLKNLVNLTCMTVIECGKMKEVVANDRDYEGKVIYLAKLERLTLEHLPSLECFSSIANCSFRFPSLECITVEECPQMKIFSKGIIKAEEWHGDVEFTETQSRVESCKRRWEAAGSGDV